jgi:hypothetical protein
MFSKYASLVLAILTERGSFDTTPEMLVNHALEVLSGLVQADRAPDQIATQREVEDATTVRIAEESTLKDVTAHIVHALNKTRVLKAFSGQADLEQGFSDELWREADLLAADLELALDRIDPEELKGWLESRW